MTCDFTSFSTAFQLYQDNEMLIMKGCVQWNHGLVEKITPRAGLELGTERSLGQCLIELPRLLNTVKSHIFALCYCTAALPVCVIS